MDLTALPLAPAPMTVAVCAVVGKLAKRSKRIPDELIPALVTVAGALIYPALSGWNVLNIFSGLLYGASATGLHQIAHQFRK